MRNWMSYKCDKRHPCRYCWRFSTTDYHYAPAKEIGADSYAEDAISAIDIASRLIDAPV